MNPIDLAILAFVTGGTKTSRQRSLNSLDADSLNFPFDLPKFGKRTR